MILLRAIVPVALTLVACGGSDFVSLGNGADGGDATPDGAGTADAPNPPPADGSQGDSIAPPADGSMQSVDSATADGPAAACPDVTGSYAVTIVQAVGCGDLSANARQCIRASVASICDVTFVSASPAGSILAINGNASIQVDGSFTGAALREGTVQRTGCTGTWDAPTSTMTVDCGGSGSAQSCVVSLLRTNTKCP
jgi:hypothetical protein